MTDLSIGSTTLDLFDPNPEHEPLILRGYQEDALDNLRDGMRRGFRRQMLCAPTGSGKTVVAAALIKAAVQKGSRVAFLLDRIALADQTSQVLHGYGIPHGMIQGDNRHGLDAPIQILSMQSVEKNPNLGALLGSYDLLIYDEAHALRKAIIAQIVEQDLPTIGLSATPFTAGLSDIYGRVINVRSTDALMADGYLSPLKVFFGEPIPDPATMAGGEYTAASASDAVLPLVGDIVSTYVTKTREVFGDRRPLTLLFSATTADGAELCESFNSAGIAAAQLSYRATSDERRNMIADFRTRRLTMLISCFALERGFDVPEVECLILARKYRRSLASVVQQLGRGQRIADGKSFVLVLDHARNVPRFSDRLEEFWAHGVDSLAPKKLEKLNEPVTKEAEERAAERECKGCGFMLPQGVTECPSCGRQTPRRRSDTEYVAGTMEEYKRVAGVGDIWPSLSHLAVRLFPEDMEKATLWARMRYRDLSGRYPEWGRPLAPATACAPAVEKEVDRQYKKWKREQKKKGKKRA